MKNPTGGPEKTGHERRAHARIHVDADIEVWGEKGRSNCRLKDLSRGGARIVTAESVGTVGDTVHLLLAFSGLEVTIMAEIVRVELSKEGQTLGVRFSLVEPAMKRALHELLDIFLVSERAEGRRHARVSRRLDLQYGTEKNRVRALLSDISRGGISMTVEDPLTIDERVTIAIPDGAGGEPLALPAQVVNQRTVVVDGITMYRVGLRFVLQELTAETRSRLHTLLRQLV